MANKGVPVGIPFQQAIAGSIEEPAFEPVIMVRSTLTREELAKKKVPELKALAKELNVLFSSSTKKDDLIARILARPADGRSEQRAIQDI